MRGLVLRGFVCMACVSLTLGNTITERLHRTYFRMPEGTTDKDYLPNTVVFKIKPEHKCTFIPGFRVPPQLDEFFKTIGAYDFKRRFPHVMHPRPDRKYNGPVPDLTSIYYFKYMGGFSLEYVINKLIQTGLFEYVEPFYIPHLLFTPNDPSYSQQWHLPKIKADSAWDYTTGSSSVVVAIVDTGVDYTHPDLAPNVLVNSGEIPNNGIDDDNNGYVDDYYGWDFGNNDNNPMPGTQSHGTHVAGCASARTNNAIGIASPGFSCKILCVRIDNAGGQLIGGYDGIIYAAERGAHFINTSWGSTFYSSAGQDVVNYAYALGSIVIAGAGNNGNTDMFYPAAYDNVVAVASTGQNDTKSSFSSYGYWVDICAPGENIYSTVPGGGYAGMSGTSMASPVMAGSCALIKSMFPSYTPLQAVARAKATAYDIYPLNPLSYKYRLGAGRVNLYKAVSAPQIAYVEMINKKATDNKYDLFLPGDTIYVTGYFQNFLAPTSNISITLTTFSPYIQILDGTTTISSLNTMQIDSNATDPFVIYVKPTAPLNTEVWITAIITDGNFTAYSSFNIFVNKDYINVTINELHTTITSKGLIGYNNFGQSQGLGVKFMGYDLLYEMGIMIGSNNKVVDFIRNGTSNDADFQIVSRVQEVVPPPVADFEAEGIFNDNAAPPSDILNITVRHHTYAWNKPGHTRYIIVEYTIKNTGSSVLSPLYAGIFADWDIPNDGYANNRCKTVPSHKFNYVYNLNIPLYGGVQVVSPTPFISYCINNDGSGGSVNIYDDYTSAEKYTTLTTMRDTAGSIPGGTDVSSVTSTGPFTLAPGDSITTAFAILVDTSLAGLIASADSAYYMYNGGTLTNNIGLDIWQASWNIFPNPARDVAFIEGISSTGCIHLSMSTIHGKTILNERLCSPQKIKRYVISMRDLPSGIYIVRITDEKGFSYNFPLLHEE